MANDGEKVNARRTGWRAYAAATAVTVTAFVLRLAFDPVLGPLQPYAFFYVAVGVSAWWCGLGPAAFAWGAGLVAGTFFFTEPRFALTWGNLPSITTYTAVSGCLMGLLWRARRSEAAAMEHASRAKSAEADFKRQNALLSALADSVLDGILIVSPDGRLLYKNEQFTRIWNFPPDVLRTGSDEAALNWAEQQTADPVQFRAVVAEAYKNPDRAVRGELLMKDGRVLDRFGTAIVRNGVHYGWVWTFRDISASKRAEAEIERERARLEAVLEACPAGIVVADAQGRILRRNTANQRLLGEAPAGQGDDITQWKGWWSDGEPVAPKEWALARSLQGEVVLGDLVDIEPFDAPGSRRTIINSGAPVRDRTGSVIGGVSAQIDITDLKRAERAVREGGERLQRIINSAMDAVISVDSENRIVLFNTAAEEIFQCPAEESVGSKLDRFIPAMRRAESAPAMRRIMDGGTGSLAGAATALRSNGEEFPIEASVSQVESGGRNLRTIILRDITERKRVEDAMRESEERFRAMADNIAQLAWMADAGGHISWYNKRWFEYTGATLEQMQGWGWRQAHHPDHADRVLQHWRDRLQRGEPWEDVFPLRRHDGHWGWFLSRAIPIRDAEGRITRWFGTNTDITELRETQDALYAAQEQLQRHAAALEKTVAERTAELRESLAHLETFSYSITHDLRAPLRTMSSFATLLQEEYGNKLDAEGRSYVERIIGAAARMDALIRDVLQYSRITSGNVMLEPVELGNFTHDIVKQYPNLAEQKNCIFIEDSCLDTWALANPSALTQVVSNLLSNALKFVPADRAPRVRISCEQQDGRLRLTVADNGVGIAPEHKERIFGLFQRLHNQQQYSGTGVGLAIVKKAVERMGGTLGVESEPGVGSQFWVDLPAIGEQGENARREREA